MAKLFDYLKRLTNKELLEESQEQFEKDYSPYMVNRFFSCDKRLLMVAKEMNRSGITKQMHFDFLDTVVPKKRKFLKYNLKKAKLDKERQYISEFYQVNAQRAKEYYRLMSEDDMQEIINFFEKRGKK